MSLNPTVAKVTDRIVERSRGSRDQYLDQMRAAVESGKRISYRQSSMTRLTSTHAGR